MTPERKKRGKKAYWRGVIAEYWAAAYLVITGHRLLARRFRTPVGEIDLVVQKKKTIIAVEVKSRDTRDGAAYAISPKQQQRLSRAAGYVLKKYMKDGMHFRFDAVFVVRRLRPVHMKNVFMQKSLD